MDAQREETTPALAGRADQQACETARRQAWAWVVTFFIVVNGVDALYAAARVEMSAAQVLLIRVLAITVFWRLLRAECQPYRVAFPLDAAFFLYVTSFLTLPYYLWRTQRWRGLGKVLIVVTIGGISYAGAWFAEWAWARTQTH